MLVSINKLRLLKKNTMIITSILSILSTVGKIHEFKKVLNKKSTKL